MLFKTILFYSFLIVFLSVSITWICCNPMQNSTLIRNHFTDFNDEIINNLEFQNFRDQLSLMKQSRQKNLIRLSNYIRTLLKNNTKNISKLTYRVYNFTTGTQFEDEFDCDLNLLTDCESSLLRKVEIIEGRRTVFKENRTEEEEVSSQIDTVNVCRSMEKEFTCLIKYADKCEERMSWSTFSILKYIITQNNETIVTCKQKEIEWIGDNNQSISNFE